MNCSGGGEVKTYAASLEDVRTAAARIRGIAHRTPVVTCASIDRFARSHLFFKCENLQKGGAFKFRGAWNSVSQLSESEAGRGVVTHSSGNHAQALALAARQRGIPANIVMPSNAASIKRRAVEEYGGIVIECTPTLDAREKKAEEVLEETGGTLIPPYDAPNTIAGQGTVALELIAQVSDLDAIIAPVGGGGLVCGICVAAHGVDPKVRIFAAEPMGADDAARSFAAGKLIPQTSPKTIADGLLTSLGQLTWPIIRDHVEEILTVGETEIIDAMRLVWERAKIVIEPSAAVAVAAALSDRFHNLRGVDRVGVVLSGGNVDLDRLPWNVPLNT
jgi:threonine dehydratase/serine racemase